MRGAGQTRVEGAHGDFDVVEQAFGKFATVKVLHRHFAHGFVHRLVVVGGGNDQIGADDLVVFVDVLVMDQCAARRFDHADADFLALAGDYQIRALQVVVVQQFLDRFGGMQHFDHPRPVIAQR